MIHQGHLDTFNHFSIVTRDAGLFRQCWETAFNVRIPEIIEPKEGQEKIDLSKLFTYAPTYRGGPWPAGKNYGVTQVSVPPLYQPHERMIEVKAAGTMPSGINFYEHGGNGVQYLGIVEGDNRDPFLKELKEKYDCEKLEEMFYDPLPGDFCIVDTQQVLGTQLCVKKDGALNGRVEVILPETAEAAILVDDLDTAVRNWTDIFAIPTPKIQQAEETCLVREKAVQTSFRYARIEGAPFELYLIESKGPGPFETFVKRKGHGIHHIAFDLGKETSAFTDRMKNQLEIDVLAEYHLDGKLYTVFDSAEKMGTAIAVRQEGVSKQSATN